MNFSDEDLIPLSGIQHYVFCPRQWALWQLDQVWDDNALTVEGSWLHRNVDNPFFRESGADGAITLRGLRVASHTLGFSGICDAVEIYPKENAPKGKKAMLKSGQFEAMPVEYKHGRPKANDCDRMQVVAQAVMLEEMLGVRIDRGAVFYWETRHREHFDITSEMRERLAMLAGEMHDILRHRTLPAADRKPHCRNCSLKDTCLPEMSGKSAKAYLRKSLAEI